MKIVFFRRADDGFVWCGPCLSADTEEDVKARLERVFKTEITILSIECRPFKIG